MTPEPCPRCWHEAARRYPSLDRRDAWRMYPTVLGAGGFHRHLMDTDARRLCARGAAPTEPNTN